MSFNIDMLDTSALIDADANDVRDTIAAYLGDEIRKAEALGVLISLPS